MRLIDADALMEQFGILDDYDEVFVGNLRAEIDNAPTIEPRPKGEWLPDNTNYYEERFVCSVCGRSYEVDTCMGEPTWDFCPGCGADMRPREGEQDG